MEATVRDQVIVHVDPSCPFAWITERWLGEVEAAGVIDLEVRLLSLAVVNEHREVDAWYRTFNDRAWGPARVMAAVVDAHGTVAGRRFYEAFGQRFHVRSNTADDVDRDVVATDALADVGLSLDLAAAATDVAWDDELRSITHASIEAVGLDVGVPLVTIGGAIASGPVLSRIPTGEAAVAVFRAAQVLAGEPGFVRLERQRVGELHVA